MLIAVTANDNNLDGIVPDTFDRAEYLLIIDAGSMRIEHVFSAREAEFPAIYFAEQILAWDCEAVLCGEIEEVPFNIIAVEGNVTRYLAAGRTVISAVAAMNDYELAYIRTFAGGSTCHDHGNHEH